MCEIARLLPLLANRAAVCTQFLTVIKKCIITGQLDIKYYIQLILIRTRVTSSS